MKIRKKLCVSMLLLCMLLCVMSITVAADNTHTHPVCGATHTDIGDHTGSCAAVVWTAWDGTSDISYGESNTAYVYLSDNATRSSTLTVTGGNTLCLCLGGKTLTGDITVEGDATLNICDCRGGGEIKTASGNAVCVKTKSKSNVHTTLNLYGGKIGSDSTFTSGAIELYNNDRNNAQTVAVFNMYGGEVYNEGAGEAAVFASYANIGQGYYELNMYGGSIRCEKGNGFALSNNENVTMQITGGTITSGDYGVDLSSNNKLTLSGNPQFIDKKYYSSNAGIYIPNGVTLTVTDDFAPAGGTTVSVRMFIDDATGTAVIATPASGKSLSAKAQYFTSAVEGCFVECNADGNLSLTKCAITGQPTKGNRYTVSANGTPNYQWWSTKRGDISVTDERATADTFYYSEWREEWYYSTEASDGTAVTLKAFTLHMAAGDVLTLNNVRDVDSSYFYLTGVSITRSGGSSTPLTGTYDDYTFTAPADGEYTVEITAEWAVGSSSYYMNFSFTATVSGDVTDAELSGQTDKTLDTTALENGRYICAVTWGNTTLYSDAAEVHNHTWNDGEVTTAPTCTVAGVKTFTCTTCNETKTEPVDALGHDFAGGAWQSDGTNHWKKCSRCDVTGPKSAHTWNDGEVTTAPTCTVAGVKTFTCTTCNETKTEPVDALGHDFAGGAWQSDGTNHWKKCSRCDVTGPKSAHTWNDGEVTTAPTCTVAGEKTFTCTECSATNVQTIDALGHDFTGAWQKDTDNHWKQCSHSGCTATDGKAAHRWAEQTILEATCTADGKKLCICKDCLAANSETLPATGHTLTHHAEKAPTCTEIGWNAYDTCACGYTTYVELPALGHDKIHHNAKAVTCTENGWNAYETCSRCSYTTFEELPALDHDKIHHDAQAATCVNIGWNAYDTCSRCAYTTYAELPALGHTAISHDAKAPTCTEKGWRAFVTCEHCDYTTYAETPALGHDRIHHNAKAVTCTEKGWEAYETCSRCDYTTFAELPALGHDKIAHEGQAPTCVNIGWEAYDTCSRCAYTTYAELPALGHTAISHDAKAATCTEKGWRAYVTCEHCDYTTYAETPALGHDRIHHNAKAVTCTEKGWNAYETCSRCDYTTFAELPALGHDKIHHDAKAATCINIGWEAYDTCSRCAYTTYAELPALGHTTISHDAKAATCTEKGWRAYITCEHCDYTTYAETPALGHDKIHHNAKAVTCTEKGWNAYETCSRCSYTTFAELPALDHDKIHHDAQAPTCVNIGWNAYDTCSRCAYTTYAELPALGHTAISHDAKAATCTEKGWRAYVTCEHCDYTTYAELPALGHDKIHHDAKAATCVNIGWEAYDTCPRCSYSTYQEIPVLGHDKVSHEAKAATCTEIGWSAYDTCSRCDYSTYVETPALGHDFTGAWQKDDNNHWKQCSRCTATDGKAAHRQSAGDVLAKASCTADGQKIYICEDCFATKSETLPATGHTLTHHEARAATCTEKGWNAYDTCETCGYTTYAETPALGHDFGDAWKSDAAKHWKECSRCDAVAGRASHTGGTATCHDSAVCTVCATSYGERNPDYHTGGSEIRDMTEPTAEKAGHTGNRYCKGCNAKLSDGAGIPALSDLSLDQKSDLTAATEAMKKILDDWYSDFTEEQKELLTDRIRATGSALASMEKAEEAVKKAEALPAADKTRPDDQSAMDAYDAAKNAYDALSDAEKELAGERTKSALDAVWKALTAYDVIDGNGSTWANTDNEGLTFTVNGHHEKFAGLLINGATVDAKYYVIQAGSTVITLKAEYLQTLSAGKYTVTVRYTDGSTDGEDSFTVTENKTVTPSGPAASSDPDAADGTATHRGVVVGIILAIICVLVLIFLLLFFKKRRKEEK